MKKVNRVDENCYNFPPNSQICTKVVLNETSDCRRANHAIAPKMTGGKKALFYPAQPQIWKAVFIYRHHL